MQIKLGPGWVIAGAFALACMPMALSYTPLVTTDGRPLKWPIQRKFNLAIQPVDQSGLSDSAVFGSVLRGIRRWQKATLGVFNFDLWMGTDRRFFVPANSFNGYSNIYFNSQAEPASRIQDGSLIAYTQVWYDPQNATILETDIVLNDTHFQFTELPSDSTSTNSQGRVFIDTIVTHELGHALGLSHSLSAQATMFPAEAKDQYRLSCDDQAGILHHYPQRLGVSTGVLYGRVENPSGGPMTAVQVQAISRRRGVAMATVTSDRNGFFTFGTLEPGEYALKLFPASTIGTGLPAYFQDYQHNICNGSLFPHQYRQDQGQLTIWNVSSGQWTSAGALRIQCGAPANLQAYGGAITLSTGQPFAWVDGGTANTTRSYRFENVQGRLEIRALSMSVFSPVKVSFSLAGQNGIAPIYQSESGFSNWDTVAIFENLAPGTYTVQAQITSLAQSMFPGGSGLQDQSRQWVIMGNVRPEQAMAPSMPEVFAFNAKCRSEDNLSPYQSPGGDPGKSGNVGFCGTVRKEGQPAPPFDPMQVFNWFLPWLAMGTGAGLVRRRLREAENKIH